MIETICKDCGNKKSFDDDKLGKKFKCPNCGNVVPIGKIKNEEISTKPIVEKPSQPLHQEKNVSEKSNKQNPIIFNSPIIQHGNKKPDESKKKQSSFLKIFGIIGIVITIGVSIFIWKQHNDEKEQFINLEKQRVEQTIAQVNQAIAQQNYEFALSMLNNINWQLNPDDNKQFVEQYNNQRETLRQIIQKADTLIIEQLTLISSGVSNEGGRYFIFKNKKGEEINASQLPENAVKYSDSAMYVGDVARVEEKYLNKKYTLKYKLKRVHHQDEESISDYFEMIISEMVLAEETVDSSNSTKPEGTWVVLLGSFESIDNAKTLIEKCKRSNIDVSLLNTNDFEKLNKNFYFVCAGKELSENDAKNIADNIKSKGFDVFAKDAGNYIRKSDEGTGVSEPVKEEIVSDKEEIFTIAEQMPIFPGGEAVMMKWVKDKIESIGYPQMEKEAGISGTCYVTFVIDKEGNVINPKLLRGVSGAPGYDKVALAVVNSMPKWASGKQNGRSVSVQYNLPIKFTLR